MNLEVHRCSKETELASSENLLFCPNWPKLPKNDLKIDIFELFFNLDHHFFLIFSMKLGDYKGVKLHLLDFSERFPFTQKRAKNEQKRTFGIISQSRVIVFFTVNDLKVSGV